MNRKAFYEAVRNRLFGGRLEQAQVDGMEAVLNEWERRGLTDCRFLAYMLATAKHETNATMQAVREAYWLSEEWRRTHLRYWPYYGRGLVQLTWEANYRKMMAALQGQFPDLDLVNHPDEALRPEVSVAIMFEGMLKAETGVGDFTGRCLEQFFNATTDDPVGARQIINGLDRAGLVAGFHYDFLAALHGASACEKAA